MKQTAKTAPVKKHQTTPPATIEGDLHNLFMQAPAMIAIVRGSELTFEFANPLYLKVVGKSEAIIGKPLLEALPELKGQDICDILTNVFKTGEPFIGNEVPVKLDRSNTGVLEDVYFNFIYQPVRDEAGRVDGIMTHAVEVTDQVLTKRKLQESEEWFRTMADNIPVLAWMANADGWIFWYNSRWYEYTGFTPKDMEGWGWQSVHDPKTLPKVLEGWKDSIATGTPFDMVFPLKGGDGTFKPFLTRVTPIKDENGKITRWFGTNTDITHQKELERQKDDFIGIASHELKTPVTSIKAYAQILERRFTKSGDTAAAKNLSRINAQVDRLTNLIGDLLDVTKIETGRLAFHHEKFDFDALLGEAIETLQFTTELHKITRNGKASSTIVGDRERIYQVLVNLISNAIKYSPHTNKIIVHASSADNKVKACVQDFGIGISEEKQGRVFERFFRVSGPKTETFPGLGLGLYISSEIIKRLGGRIWVQGAEDEGSTFCFELPMDQKKTAEKARNDNVEAEVRHE